MLEEKPITPLEVDSIPVVLNNPAYFKPFEMFSRLLPLPKYTSFDPTIFLGIFFPPFFGMILGDIGYGALFFSLALFLRRKEWAGSLIADAGFILMISALFTALFGWFYGECFGEVGTRVFGLAPLVFHRGDAVMTMLYFSLGIGLFHVCLGLGLGFWSSIKLGKNKEGCFKISTIVLLICLTLYMATYIWLPMAQYKDFIRIALLITGLSLLFSGGWMGPLEIFKTMGNIISYSRLMAIGLTSVLLAHVANYMAWHSKSIVLGLIAAILLHGFNIVLGLFAPTVHSLRLHFVEFFSHFIESGGRKFQPLAKEGHYEPPFEVNN